MNNNEFKLALVTGASSGIGSAMCRLLASKGINLIMTGRNKLSLNALAQELSNQCHIETVAIDLENDKERQVLLNIITGQQPDLVINNAGYGYYGPVVDTSIEDSLKMIDVDVKALVEISIHSAKSLMAQKKKGVILNISSAAAMQPVFPFFSMYAASKSFVNTFSMSFDEEVRESGIRVLCACPGVVSTSFRKRAMQNPSTTTLQKDSSKHSTAIKSMTPEFAAQQLWLQIKRRQQLRIFDWKYRVMTFLTKYLLPRKIVAAVLKKNIASIAGR